MRRNKSPFIVMVASVLFAGIAAFSGSLAWFTATAFMQNEDNPIEGSVEDEYYASGLGTSDDPFVITKPRHLYNLAWLQYLGFYNKNSGPDNHQFYFKLGDNIDMSKFGAIPPIGSELNPFVGNFNGAGYVVSNVTISNDFNDFTSHPSSISAWDNNTTHKQPHIMGFFGVIGEYPGGNKNSAYDTTVNEFKNTGLTGVTIKTVLSDSLAGVAAGYVRDSSLSDTHTVLKNVVVDNSTISLPQSGTTSSYGKDVNNVNLTDISEYTLVGYTNNTSSVVKASKSVYGVNVDNNYTFNATESGNVNGWGGSVDMKSVLERLITIKGTKNKAAFPFKKTITHRANGTTNETVTNTSQESNAHTVTLVNDNDQIGHFQFLHRNDSYDANYAMFGGGHYEVDQYYEYRQSAKISVQGPHYLNGIYSNRQYSIADTTVQNDAVNWQVPSAQSGSGTIYATINNSTRYLTVTNNTTLGLTNNESNATVFQRSEANGKVRFTYNGYYLDYDNSWKMTRITGAPIEPPKPTPPTPPDAPTLPAVPVKPKQADYFNSVSQIVDSDNYLNYSNSVPATFISTPSQNPWSFSSELTNNGTTTIYITIDGTNYYIANSTNDSGNATFSTSSGATWTAVGSDNHYRFYYRYQTSWSLFGGRTTYYYYLKNNNGNLYLYRSAGNANLDTSLATEFEIKSVDIPDVAAYNAAYSSYESDLEEYNNAVESYDEEMAAYDALYAQYLIDVEHYETVEYPEYQDDLAEFMTTSAAFDATTHKLTVTGSLSNTDYLDHETGGMNYDDDDVTYFPLSTVNNTDDFKPDKTNTGYIVSGSNISSSDTNIKSTNSIVRFSNLFGLDRWTFNGSTYPKSLSDDYNPTTGEFSAIYTIKKNGNNLVRSENIANDYKNYVKLKQAKETLGNVMKTTNNPNKKAYGVHFMDAAISMDALMTADYVKVNGKEYYDYQLPVNSIDFHLKEFGYINFMAGTYYRNSASDRNDSFFSIYKIERLDESPNTIHRILEIKNVYQHNSKNKTYSYVYELSDGETTFFTKPYVVTSSEGDKEWLYDTMSDWSNNQYVNALPQNYTKVFDVDVIKKNNINGTNATNDFDYHPFYFEIPMNDGEYCLGSVAGATGAYLMYLDIAANAAKTNRTIVFEKFAFTQKTYTHPLGVALQPLPTTYTSGTAVINVNSVIDDVDSACMEIKPTANGDYTMDRNANSVAITRSNTTLAPPIYAGEGITLTGSGDLDPVPISSSSHNIQRMQYFDYMINTNTLCVTTFTDYYSTSGTFENRVIEQNKYSGTAVTDSPTSTLIYDPTGILGTVQDDSEDMKIYNTSTGISIAANVFTNYSRWAIDSSRLSDTKIIEFKFIQDGDSYTDSTTLVVTLDTDASQTDTYYKYENYTIVLTPSEGGSVTITIIDYTGSFTTYTYNAATDETEESSVTTVIIINDTTVTGEGQTIPNP